MLKHNNVLKKIKSCARCSNLFCGMYVHTFKILIFRCSVETKNCCFLCFCAQQGSKQTPTNALFSIKSQIKAKLQWTYYQPSTITFVTKWQFNNGKHSATLWYQTLYFYRWGIKKLHLYWFRIWLLLFKSFCILAESYEIDNCNQPNCTITVEVDVSKFFCFCAFCVCDT